MPLRAAPRPPRPRAPRAVAAPARRSARCRSADSAARRPCRSRWTKLTDCTSGLTTGESVSCGLAAGVHGERREVGADAACGAVIGEFLMSLSASAVGPAAARVEIRLDHAHDLRRRRADDVAQHDVAVARAGSIRTVASSCRRGPYTHASSPSVSSRALGVARVHRSPSGRAPASPLRVAMNDATRSGRLMPPVSSALRTRAADRDVLVRRRA